MNLKPYHYLLLGGIVLSMFLIACNTTKDTEAKQTYPEGDGYTTDSILFQKEISFSSASGTSDMTTKYDGWTIAFVDSHNGELQSMHCPAEDTVSTVLTHEWASIQKIDVKKVRIHVNENTNEQSRSISIRFFSCGFANFLTVKQEGKK